jgi:hypothetical protein
LSTQLADKPTLYFTLHDEFDNRIFKCFHEIWAKYVLGAKEAVRSSGNPFLEDCH